MSVTDGMWLKERRRLSYDFDNPLKTMTTSYRDVVWSAASYMVIACYKFAEISIDDMDKEGVRVSTDSTDVIETVFSFNPP